MFLKESQFYIYQYKEETCILPFIRTSISNILNEITIYKENIAYIEDTDKKIQKRNELKYVILEILKMICVKLHNIHYSFYLSVVHEICINYARLLLDRNF